jgi:hypothetical protein
MSAPQLARSIDTRASNDTWSFFWLTHVLGIADYSWPRKRLNYLLPCAV